MYIDSPFIFGNTTSSSTTPTYMMRDDILCVCLRMFTNGLVIVPMYSICAIAINKVGVCWPVGVGLPV